jgi:hypothetical protein
MTCHGCEREGLDCHKTFVCAICHERKNVCDSLVGGFEATEPLCPRCHYFRATGRTLVSKYARHTSAAYQEAM